MTDPPHPSATPGGAPPPPPHLQGWDEDLYQATAAALVEPESNGSAWAGLGCLAASAGLFALSVAYADRFATLALILPVLFLHEAGHFVGMRLFGYRNLRMFFIPFFGAAVSGRKHAAPAWQQVVVLLLGPLPGLALALALQAALRPSQDAWAGDLVVWLVILNGLNLLPVVPLDGGRVVDVLFFARQPWPAVALRLLAAAALVTAAYLTWGLASRFETAALALMGALVLLGTPLQFRRARLQRAFGHNPLALPGRLDEIGDAQRRELFGWAARLHPFDRDPLSLAADMRTLHEHMVTRRPGVGGSLLLLGLYLAGFVTAFAALGLSLDDTRQARALQVETLLARFDEAVAEIEEVRRTIDAVPKARWPALRERVKGRWDGLVEAWKRAPAPVRRLAMQELSRRTQFELQEKAPGARQRQMEAARLAGELGLPSVPAPPS